MIMPTWILTGTDRHGWDDDWWDDAVRKCARGNLVHTSRSTGSATSLRTGDRFFLLRQGRVRGVVGSGWITAEVRRDRHWSERSELGARASYAGVAFDTVVDAADRLRTTLLEEKMPDQHWTPQASGTRFRVHLETQLEELWSSHLGREAAEPGPGTFPEGTVEGVKVNRYERSPPAREACLQEYGTACAVCGFDFERRYGPGGTGTIVVHHLEELSTVPRGHEVDPIKDLRPVCPNCHLMIHTRRHPAYSIEEVQAMLRHAGTGAELV